MRNLRCILRAEQNITLMTEIMRHQNKYFNDNGGCIALPPECWNMAKALAFSAGARCAHAAGVMRLAHDTKTALSELSKDEERYLNVLSGQILCMIGDECPALNAGEVWQLVGPNALLINKSGDDAIVLDVIVKIETHE